MATSEDINLAVDIVRGYQSKPQTEDEWDRSDEATVRMIGEEPLVILSQRDI